MRKLTIKFLIVIVCLFCVGYILKIANNNKSNPPQTDNEMYKNVTTMIISVVDKFNEVEPKRKYFIEARNAHEPYQEFTIVIDDERVWNLINKQQNYLVVVEWMTSDRTGNIEGKQTKLAQIEQISLDEN